MNSPIPRGSQQTFNEGSALRSLRDGTSTSRQWSKNKQVSQANDAIMRSISKLQKDLGRLRRRIVGGGGSQGASGVDYQGEYDPSKTYSAKVVVRFTPDGGAAGTYISLQSVAGISPDEGYPNWDVFIDSSPGMWL